MVVPSWERSYTRGRGHPAGSRGVPCAVLSPEQRRVRARPPAFVAVPRVVWRCRRLRIFTVSRTSRGRRTRSPLPRVRRRELRS
jgi:hypothetical protein